MSDKKSSQAAAKGRKKPALPNIHPDDAKDKVFTAILKALLKKGNKPSSPKELANDIIKYKYATLGGATPFATVSSRISQHFKRAAEHNPPRPPLLAKHVDQKHSRKINYSLANTGSTPVDDNDALSSDEEDVLQAAMASAPPRSLPVAATNVPAAAAASSSSSSSTVSEKRPSTRSHTAKPPHHTTTPLTTTTIATPATSGKTATTATTATTTTGTTLRHSTRRRRPSRRYSPEPNEDEARKKPRRMSMVRPTDNATNTTNATNAAASPALSHASLSSEPHDSNESDDDDDVSDYYEDMMKGDEIMDKLEFPTTTTTTSMTNTAAGASTSTETAETGDNASASPAAAKGSPSMQHLGIPSSFASRRRSSMLFRRPSITSSTQHGLFPPSPKQRKLSFNGLLGEHEFWTPYSFEQDILHHHQDVDLFVPSMTTNGMTSSSSSTSEHPHDTVPSVPLNIAAPESITDKELELYFGGPSFHPGDPALSSSSSAARSSRRSFTAVSHAKEASLLQQALLASTSRKQSTATLDSTTPSSQTSYDDEDDTTAGLDADDDALYVRRRSWPLMAAELDAIQQEFDPKQLIADATAPPPPAPLAGADHDHDGDADDDMDDDMDVEVDVDTDVEVTMDVQVEKDETMAVNGDASDNNDENKVKDEISKVYREHSHEFTITRKLIGNLQCYELDSPTDIPDTKVLRFIASKDGSSEHVALRTRHADAAKQAQRGQSKDAFYLVEGCINASQLRKAARPVLGKGTFDAEEEAANGRLVVQLKRGPLDARGAWVPLVRARELVDEFEIESSPGLARLLSDDPMDLQQGEDDAMVKEEVVAELDTYTQEKKDEKQDDKQDDEFVKFEEDEQKKAVADKEKTPDATPATSLATSSTSSAESSQDAQQQQQQQQWMQNVPGLNVDLAKTLQSYLQSINKAGKGVPADFKALLARFPALDTLLKKQQGEQPQPSQPSQPPPLTLDTSAATLAPPPASQAMHSASAPVSPSASSPSTTTTSSSALLGNGNKIFPSVPTDLPMYITLLDNVSVCVATLVVKNDKHDEQQFDILRRLDTGFVNGTSLLTAGGIDTERERSMILSFEIERIRIPNPESQLYGTWIPLHRAQELAVTCSIQHRLAPFLSDRIEAYFPSPLPISRTPSARGGKPIMALRKQARAAAAGGLSLDKHLMAAAATSKVPPLPSPSTQLHQLLLSHPYKMLNKPGYGHVSPMAMLKAPLLGSFDRSIDLQHQRQIAVITNQGIGHTIDHPTAAGKTHATDDSDDIDIMDDDDERQQRRRKKHRHVTTAAAHAAAAAAAAAAMSAASYSSAAASAATADSDQDTESDTDIHEVRQRMKRMRDAAIDAMETGQSLDLEELLTRASGPIVQPFKRRRVVDMDEANANTASSSTFASSSLSMQQQQQQGGASSFRKPANFLPHARRKPPTHPSSPASKLAASLIKKSASWNGALASPRHHPPSHVKRAPQGSHLASAMAQLPGGPLPSPAAATPAHTKRKRPSAADTKAHGALAQTAASSPLAHTTMSSSSASPSPSPSPSPAHHTPDTKHTTGKKHATPAVADDNANAMDATAIRLNKSTVSDEDEDEDVDIGGSDDDDDVR